MRARPRFRPPRFHPASGPSRVGYLLHRLREDLLSQWKVDLQECGGTLGPELLRYRAGYERDFERPWSPSTPDELIGALSDADIVFCGDHHLLAPAQRLLLRLLRHLVPGDRPATLALEMLHSRDQALVDSFLAGRLDARFLRDAVSYDTRWPFDWDAYYPLLEFARRRRLPVLAINSEPGHPRASTIARRDEHAALRLVDRMRSEPDGRIFVLAGDWHIAGRHLPARVEELARSRHLRLRRIIVHQNHDGLYRRLMKRLGHVPAVVRGGRDLFCVLNSTPLAKARAQLAWVGRRQSNEESAPDSAAAFQDVARALIRHLQLDPSPLNGVTPWELENEGELAAASQLLGWGRTHRLRQWRRLLRGDVLHLRRRGFLLLRHPPLHRLAEAAADLLGAAPGELGGLSPRECYAARAVHSGTLVFATRLINPRWKCDLFADLLNGEQVGGAATAAAVWTESLLQGLGAPPLRSSFWRLPPRRLGGAARRLGAAWGYALFDSYVAGRIAPSFVRSLFSRAREDAKPLIQLAEAMRATSTRHRTLSKRQLL